MTSSATTISADRQWNKPYSKPQLDCRQNICIVNYIALKIKFQQCCWIKFTWIGCRIKLYCSILRCFVVIVVGTFCVQKFFRHAHPSNTPFTYPPFLFTFLGSYNSHNISRFSKLPPHVPSFPLYCLPPLLFMLSFAEYHKVRRLGYTTSTTWCNNTCIVHSILIVSRMAKTKMIE